MTEIALYETLKKIPDVTPAEAKEAVADVAKSGEVATKADLERMERVLIMWMVGVGLAIIGIVITAVELMITTPPL